MKDNMTNKEKFKLLWENKKTKAMIKLGMYFLFIVLVLVIITIGSKMSSSQNIGEEISEDVVSYEDLINNFNNYRYQYEILSGEEKILYSGIKLNNQELGTRENSVGIIKYYIDETGIYQVQLDNKIVFDTLYENAKEDYFNLNTLFATLKNMQASDGTSGLYQTKTYYLGDINNVLSIIVYYDETIKEIMINDGVSSYKIKLSDIGNIKEEDFN